MPQEKLNEPGAHVCDWSRKFLIRYLVTLFITTASSHVWIVNILKHKWCIVAGISQQQQQAEVNIDYFF